MRISAVLIGATGLAIVLFLATAARAQVKCPDTPSTTDVEQVAKRNLDVSGLAARIAKFGLGGEYDQKKQEILNRFNNADQLLARLSHYATLCQIITQDKKASPAETADLLNRYYKKIFAPTDCPMQQLHSLLNILNKANVEASQVSSLVSFIGLGTQLNGVDPQRKVDATRGVTELVATIAKAVPELDQSIDLLNRGPCKP